MARIKVHELRNKSKPDLLTQSKRLLVYKNKKYLPLDLSPKKFRAIRKRLTKHHASLTTDREKKKKEMYL
ncbi:hypothetical protein H5410_036860, partial [Solanum commersonii]